MLFGVLGPLQVRSGKARPRVLASRQRVVLAALALRAGQTVPADELIAAIWDDDRPAAAHVALRNYVSRLRRVLGPAGARIVTSSPGYLLDAAAEEVDALTFARLYQAGDAAVQAGDWVRVAVVLDEALALWRGTPLSDVPSRELRERHVPALEAMRAQAAQWHSEAVQRQAQRPLRQDLAPAVSAGSAGAASHGHGTGLGYLVPRQLPAAVRHFTGREAQRAELSALLGQAASAVVIAAIDGTAGVGKTALAVHWAHRAADHFPGGQLYANLRGYDPGSAPLPASSVLRDFLESLGVPGARVPSGLDAQSALFRTVLASRQVLIVLDNARDADQVRPLLPGSPGSMVLITSRARLAGLAAEADARLIGLDLPAEAEALELLTARLGAEVVAAERAAAREITMLCARLPLALAIAASRAAVASRSADGEFAVAGGTGGSPLAVVAAELRSAGGRLDALDTGTAASSVRAAFASSFRALPPGPARMFLLLGRHPGPDISVAAAASLAGLDGPAAWAALRELTQAGLLAEPVQDRYALHDLLRDYSGELAATSVDQDARQRMLDHYLHSAESAAVVLDPVREPQVLAAPAAGVTPETAGDQAQALAWFQAEHKILLELISGLAAQGNAQDPADAAYARSLPWTLVTYLGWHRSWTELAAIQRIQHAAAGGAGDLAAQSRAHRELGRALIGLGDLDQALAEFRHGAELCERLGDLPGEARVNLCMGVALSGQARVEEALASSVRALLLAEAAHDEVLCAKACNNIGYDYAVLGDLQRGLHYCLRAVDLLGARGGKAIEANTWDSLGYIYHQLGDHPRATASYGRAAGLFAAGGDQYGRAVSLVRLGDVHQAAGEHAPAALAWQRAAAIFDELSLADVAQVRAKLRDLPSTAAAS